MTIKEDKISITTFHWFNTLNRSPDNWVSISPVKIFGILVGRKLKVAKKNYPWNNLKL